MVQIGQLANIANQAKAVLQTENLTTVADRDDFSSSEILTCQEADITLTAAQADDY